jgi:hypothetical protein
MAKKKTKKKPQPLPAAPQCVDARGLAGGQAAAPPSSPVIPPPPPASPASSILAEAIPLKTVREQIAETQARQAVYFSAACPACGCKDMRLAVIRKNQGRMIRVRVCRHCGKKVL